MRVLLVAVVVLAALTGTARARETDHFTHRVTISGTLVDHWTVTDSGRCGLNGDGTVSIAFKWTKAQKAHVWYSSRLIDSNEHLGRWSLGQPQGFGIWADMHAKSATGTIDRVDNTAADPDPEADCEQPDKSGCGTHDLKQAKFWLEGHDRRHLLGELQLRDLRLDGNREALCGIGALENWTQPEEIAGRDLMIKMPRPRRLRAHRALTVSATTHHVATTTFDTTTTTDDVTRTVSVTFTPLHR